MVFLNYSAMQMVAKIVYYGPGLGGKTTNLKTIYKNTDDRARGEMVSLATETDRTLFFDLLPMEVGVIGGFKTKFQLYTVPGQVFYNTTRKLVLRGVDGIVFVADSQVPMMEANKESLQNLADNLAELNLTPADVPLVIQFNKRDLPNVASIEEMNRQLNPEGRPFVEASALNGVGVFETLREISKQTLMVLNKKSIGNQLEGNETPTQDPLTHHAPPPIEDSDTFTDDLEDPDSEDKDNFEKTLENLELDFEDEEDELDEASFDLSEIDEIDDTDPDEVPKQAEGGPSLDLEDEPLEIEDSGLDEPVTETAPLPDPDEDDEEDSLAEVTLEIDEAVGEDEPASDPGALVDEIEADELLAEPEPAEHSIEEQPVPAPKPRRKPKTSLDDLRSLTMRTSTKSVNQPRKRRTSNVDAMLEGLVDHKGPKRKKLHIATPFAKAQLNCVFLDEGDNVVATELVEVDHKRIGNGQYRIELNLEIDIDQSDS